MNKIFDIYTIGFLFFICFAVLYFWRSSVLQSKGYKLYGISSLLLSIALILIKFNIDLYLFLIIIGFIVVTIGSGVLMTKEKYIYEAYRRLPFFKRSLSGFYPLWATQEINKHENGKSIKSEKISGKSAILAGLLSICIGIAIFFWGKEIVYPVCLTAAGILFIIMGRVHNKANDTTTRH